MLRPNHFNRLLRQLRRAHAAHGADLEVALGHGPLEEGVQAAIAIVGGRWLPASELVRDEGLDVCALELADDKRVAVSLTVGGKQPDGVGVSLGGPGALVLSLQGAPEAPVQH